MSKRIVVVDESLVSREGYRAQLVQAGATVTAAVCHDQIHTLSDDQLRVDIALVNLADPRDYWAADDFPGIGAVKKVLGRVDRPPLTVGYTSFDDHPGLRFRAHRAGVRVIYNRSDLEDDHFEAPLGEMIISLEETTASNLEPAASESEEREELGVPSSGDVERLVTDAGELLLRQRALSAGAQYRARRRFGERNAVTVKTADGKSSDQKWPGWQQIDRIWTWLAKVEPIPDPGARLYPAK